MAQLKICLLHQALTHEDWMAMLLLLIAYGFNFCLTSNWLQFSKSWHLKLSLTKIAHWMMVGPTGSNNQKKDTWGFRFMLAIFLLRILSCWPWLTSTEGLYAVSILLIDCKKYQVFRGEDEWLLSHESIHKPILSHLI